MHGAIQSMSENDCAICTIFCRFTEAMKINPSNITTLGLLFISITIVQLLSLRQPTSTSPKAATSWIVRVKISTLCHRHHSYAWRRARWIPAQRRFPSQLIHSKTADCINIKENRAGSETANRSCRPCNNNSRPHP